MSFDYYAKNGSFEGLMASNIVGGTAQFFSIIGTSAKITSTEIETISSNLIYAHQAYIANFRIFKQLNEDTTDYDGIISAIPVILGENSYNSNILINISEIVNTTSGGNITLSTFNNSTNGISIGDINLITYGTGDINLTPIASGPEDSISIGVVNIGTLQFSMVDPLAESPNFDNLIKASNNDVANVNININPKGNGSVNVNAIGGINISDTTNYKVNISGNTVSATGDEDNTFLQFNTPVQFNAPVYLTNHTNNSFVSGYNYVNFMPQSGVQQTYTWPVDDTAVFWPSAPIVIVPTPGVDKVGPYLTTDGSGNLSFENTFYDPIIGDKTVGPYITSDIFGNLSWTSTHIPAAKPFPDVQEVTVGPYLTSPDSSGNLSWKSTLVKVVIPV